MPKSPLEKQLVDRKRRDEQKKARDDVRVAREEEKRQQASSIVNGMECVEGMRIMDKTSEEVLTILLQCNMDEDNQVDFAYEIFPRYVQDSIELELEKLTQYGMISSAQIWIDGSGTLFILPPAFTYFADKKKVMELQKKETEQGTNSIVNYGNIIYGNVSGSTITVDNSISQIEKAIEENGGEEKDELQDILNEVKELIENIQFSRSIPKQKKLYEKLSGHLEKHGWFYGAVVQLLGTAAITMLGA